MLNTGPRERIFKKSHDRSSRGWRLGCQENVSPMLKATESGKMKVQLSTRLKA